VPAQVSGLALQRMGDMAVRVGIKVRGALMTAIYRKTFRLQALHGHDAGNVVSLVSTDCIKMYEVRVVLLLPATAAAQASLMPRLVAARMPLIHLHIVPDSRVLPPHQQRQHHQGVQHFHNVWTAPLEAAAIIGLLLWRTGGVYGLPALGVVCVVLPMQYYFGYKIASFKMANVEVSDARVLRMHEVLLAIKLVKFYVWERSFAAQVEEVRS
jgi:hypothetical protein